MERIKETGITNRDVIIRDRNGYGGNLKLYAEKPDFSYSSKDDEDNKELHLTLNDSVHSIFYLAGEFGYPGTKKATIGKTEDPYGTYLDVYELHGHKPIFSAPIMVRVRKNANDLTEDERNNFLEAFNRLSLKTAKGIYEETGPDGNPFIKKPKKILDELVLMHTIDAATEIHFRSSFHPWHRLFLLHLERELQEVNPAVTVPYWKFDEAAPNVFSNYFTGIPKTPHSKSDDMAERLGSPLDLDSENPIYSYANSTLWGELKRAYHTPKNEDQKDPAKEKLHDIESEKNILAKDKDEFKVWHGLEEGKSHNKAHNAFNGQVVDMGRDPVDTLFFMLHSNTDRLWAKWQSIYDRFNATDERTYDQQGKTDYANRGKHGGKLVEKPGWLGDLVEDGLWPWHHDYDDPRPDRQNHGHYIEEGVFPNIKLSFPAARGRFRSFTESGLRSENHTPKVMDTIDYNGRYGTAAHGFDYADVPFFEEDIQKVRDEMAKDDKELVSNEELNNQFFEPNRSKKQIRNAGLLSKNGLLHREGLTNKEEQLNEKDLDEKISLLKKISGIDRTFKAQIISLLESPEKVSEIDSKIIKKNIEIKSRILWLFKEQDEDFLTAVVNKVLDSDKVEEALRSEALHLLRTSKRSSLHFPAIQSVFIEALLRILNNQANPEGLRREAIEVLGTFENIELNLQLVNLLRDGQTTLVKNNGDLLLSKIEAVSLLRSFSKIDIPLIKEIIEGTEGDAQLTTEAILALSRMPEEEAYLFEILDNNAQPF